MISVDEALARILGAVRPLPAQTSPLSAASGRILAKDVVARLYNPAFDVSAMDGYAVRAGDVLAGATLEMIGVSQAGAGFAGRVEKGQCARIFTGAPVPEGADSVIMQEETQAVGSAITFEHPVERGKSIRFRGDDFAQGDVLVRKGDRLGPQSLSLVAAGNVPELDVTTLPRIALLATGDELVAPGGAVGPDQIVSSNSVGLMALFSAFGADVTDCGIVRDDRDALGAALGTALAAEPDVLVTTGGASVGDHDFVQEMLLANGVDIDFWRIAMRPGKPLMFGRRGKTLVFGLPGNPVSALVTTQVFILPALYAMAGAREPAPLRLPLAAPLPANGLRRHFLRGRLAHTGDGRTGVVPFSQTDSGHLSSLAAAQCLIVQHEHCGGKSEGDLVEIRLL